MTRLVVLPLDCVQRLEDALRYAESHHTAHDSVRKVALAAMTDLRRNWRYADATEAQAYSVDTIVPAYDSQTVTLE